MAGGVPGLQGDPDVDDALVANGDAPLRRPQVRRIRLMADPRVVSALLGSRRLKTVP